MALMTALIALVIAGKLSGFWEGRNDSVAFLKPTVSSVPALAVPESVPTAPKPSPAHLDFRRVARVHYMQLVAAHPWEIYLQHQLKEQLSLIPEDADQQSKLVMRRKAEDEFCRSRNQVFQDIQEIVAEYAVTNGIWLVVNSDASETNIHTAVLYPPGTDDFMSILRAQSVHDVTTSILEKLARRRPSNVIKALGLVSGK